jgi:hypothetical protein
MRAYCKREYSLAAQKNYFPLHLNVRFELAYSKLLLYLVLPGVLSLCSERFCDHYTRPHLATALNYQQFSVCSPTQVAKIALKTEGDFMCGLVDLTDT